MPTSTVRMRRLKMTMAILAATLVVIVLLVVAAVWLMGGFQAIGTAQVRGARQQLATFAEAIESYVRDCGAPPTQSQGLNALLANPGVPGWSGPYLRGGPSIPTDPWLKPYRYRLIGGRPVVESSGMDLTLDTDDDLSSTNARRP